MTTADARQQIHDALLAYTRGIDRLDSSLIATAFHPEAELLNYGPDPMLVEGFAGIAVATLQKRYSAVQHRISNIKIEFTSDSTALVECYVLAYHVEPDDGGDDLLHTFNGRYVDRFDERDGQWKMNRRCLMMDWTNVEPITEKMRGPWVASGRAGSPDPLWD